MTQQTSTFERFAQVIADNSGVGISAIHPEASLEELMIDSLDHVEIIMAIEEEYDLEIADSDVDDADIQTVGDYIKVLEKYGVTVEPQLEIK